MKNFFYIPILLLLIAVSPFLIRYRYIDSGYVGIVVNTGGSMRGVEESPRHTGRTWYCPLFTTVHEFPVHEINVLWTKTAEVDESITLNSSQSAQINVDVGMTYEIRDEKVPVLFDKLRKDIDYISHQWLRNHVREQLGRVARKVDTMELLGEGATKALDEAKTALNKDLEEYGIVVHMLTFASAPRPESKIQASIDATITAKQLAIQAENKVAEAKAVAAQAVETAKGRAESVEIEAKAKLAASKLEAEANELLSKSLTPELIRLKAVERWDGILPKFSGSSVPLINVEDLK